MRTIKDSSELGHGKKIVIVPCVSFSFNLLLLVGFLGGSNGKESSCSVGGLGSVPGLGRSLGGGHGKSILVCMPGESPWTEEPGGLQSMEMHRVRHD